ncbi:MAG: hypothetical protein QOF24_2664 [Verrucomicrobiota bacterium]
MRTTYLILGRLPRLYQRLESLRHASPFAGIARQSLKCRLACLIFFKHVTFVIAALLLFHGVIVFACSELNHVNKWIENTELTNTALAKYVFVFNPSPNVKPRGPVENGIAFVCGPSNDQSFHVTSTVTGNYSWWKRWCGVDTQWRNRFRLPIGTVPSDGYVSSRRIAGVFQSDNNAIRGWVRLQVFCELSVFDPYPCSIICNPCLPRILNRFLGNVSLPLHYLPLLPVNIGLYGDDEQQQGVDDRRRPRLHPKRSNRSNFWRRCWAYLGISFSVFCSILAFRLLFVGLFYATSGFEGGTVRLLSALALFFLSIFALWHALDSLWGSQ